MQSLAPERIASAARRWGARPLAESTWKWVRWYWASRRRMIDTSSGLSSTSRTRTSALLMLSPSSARACPSAGRARHPRPPEPVAGHDLQRLEELLEDDGLLDVAVGAQGIAPHHVFLAIGDAHDHNRQAGEAPVRPDPRQDLEAGDLRQVDVQEDEIRPLPLGEHAQRLLAIAGHDQLATQTAALEGAARELSGVSGVLRP